MKNLTGKIKSEYYEITICETSRNSLREEAHTFNEITEKFKTEVEIREFLIDRYGKIPQSRIKTYQDKVEGQTGFIYSYWNQDISHMTKKYYQSDWITIKQISREVTFIKL